MAAFRPSPFFRPLRMRFSRAACATVGNPNHGTSSELLPLGVPARLTGSSGSSSSTRSGTVSYWSLSRPRYRSGRGEAIHVCGCRKALRARNRPFDQSVGPCQRGQSPDSGLFKTVNYKYATMAGRLTVRSSSRKRTGRFRSCSTDGRTRAAAACVREAVRDRWPARQGETDDRPEDRVHVEADAVVGVR